MYTLCAALIIAENIHPGLTFHLLRVESFSEYLRIGLHSAFYGHAQLLCGDQTDNAVVIQKK